MDLELMTGVNLHVLPTTQFQITRLMVTFTTEHDGQNAAARNLLANVLSTSSAKYPTQTALARHLATLYGATMGAYVSRLSKAHVMRFKSSFINDEIAGEALFPKVLALLQEIIFNPLLVKESFDSETVALQQTNVVNTLRSWDDDKQFYALRQVEELYYQHDAAMKVPGTGTADQVAAVTMADLVATYQSMLANDQIDIYVVGKVDEEAVKEAVLALPWQPRAKQVIPARYVAGKQPVRKQEEVQPVEQTKFDQTYNLPIYFGDDLYYAALVMNGILGGTPYSLLFTNVREKASLAYYASTSLRPFNGHLVLQTGIETQNLAQVRELVQTQVDLLQVGEFSAETLKMVQATLINQHQANLDRSNARLEQLILRNTAHVAANPHFEADIMAVTKEQVVAVAKQLSLQTEYVLVGGKADD